MSTTSKGLRSGGGTDGQRGSRLEQWRASRDHAQVLDVLLDLGIVETAADKTLSVENGRVRVHGSLVLGCVTNESLLGGEGDV